MSDFPRWKYALVAIAMVLGILYALPNAFVPLSAVQVAATHNAPVDAALQQKIVAELQKDKIAYQNITLRHDKAKGDNILIGFANGDLQKSAADALKPVLGDDYTAAFNLESTVPHWLQAIGAHSMPLGLDLQGGVHFLMRVDQSDVVDKQEVRYTEDITALLREKKIHYTSVTRNSVHGKGVVAVLSSEADRKAASDEIATAFPDLAVRDRKSVV